MNRFIFLLYSAFFAFFACKENTPPANQSPVDPPVVQYSGNPAIDKLTDEIAQSPSNASLYAARGAAWYENENYDEGIADMEKAISLDSTRAGYYHLLADMYLDYYKSLKALHTMEKAAATFPKRIPTLLKLAEFQFILKQYNDALFTLERIRAIDPQNAEMFFMFGRVFKDMNRMDEAANAFQSAVENDPDHADAWVHLAQLMADKKSPLAERYFDNALRLDSNNIGVLHAKAYYLSNTMNDLRGAIEIYKKINTINPQYTAGYYNTGLLYLDMDSIARAYKSFDLAVQFAPQSPDAYYHRGMAAEMMGNKKQALADYKTVLNFDPDFASAIEGVKRLQK
ncbi:MAG TPA: tetratricopeptide repeat protein [Bacteroidetes bacterium]|nr:tetratricopeptide repeat protein [Bacteroidota bacterium]